jgi:hypothetical protein
MAFEALTDAYWRLILMRPPVIKGIGLRVVEKTFALVSASLSEATSRRGYQGCRGTSIWHADRFRSSIGAALCKISYEVSSFIVFGNSHIPNGTLRRGLNEYQVVAADAPLKGGII